MNKEQAGRCQQVRSVKMNSRARHALAETACTALANETDIEDRESALRVLAMLPLGTVLQAAVSAGLDEYRLAAQVLMAKANRKVKVT